LVEMSKRAILYARVSSDDRGKDGRNLAGQLEMCRRHSLEQGYSIVAELAEDDSGASGASFELPRLSQVLALAEAGQFDVLVVRELDRLSRKLAKQLIIEEELKRHGVHIEYVLGHYDDTPEGTLMKHVRAVVAEYERLKITERIVRGKRQRVKAGSVLVYGRPPYGYEVVKDNGKWRLVPKDPEARFVRLIFSWYTQGNGTGGPIGMSAIARKLTDMGIPTYADTHYNGDRKKRGWAEWSTATIQAILRNETYCGVWHYGKRRGRLGERKRNPDEHLVSVKVDKIIEREVWEAAQTQMIANRNSTPHTVKYDYLLARRVICGECGLKMAGTSTRGNGKVYQYYRCPATNSQDYARDCDMPGFRVVEVDTAVWEWVKSLLTDREALANGLEAYQVEGAKENEPVRQRVQVIDDLLAENRTQRERLLDLFLSGEFPRDMLSDRKARLDATITALEKERSGLVAHLERQVLSNEQIESLQDFATEVNKGLEVAEDDFQTRRDIVELLDVQVTLVLEDGERVVYARCMLGEHSLAPNPGPRMAF
jgi:site-specific DNA recombinase